MLDFGIAGLASCVAEDTVVDMVVDTDVDADVDATADIAGNATGPSFDGELIGGTTSPMDAVSAGSELLTEEISDGAAVAEVVVIAAQVFEDSDCTASVFTSTAMPVLVSLESLK